MFYWLFNNVCTSKGAAHAQQKAASRGKVEAEAEVEVGAFMPRLRLGFVVSLGSTKLRAEAKGRNKSSSDMSQALCVCLA